MDSAIAKSITFFLVDVFVMLLHLILFYNLSNRPNSYISLFFYLFKVHIRAFIITKHSF